MEKQHKKYKNTEYEKQKKVPINNKNMQRILKKT